jgi:hypothetical protein
VFVVWWWLVQDLDPTFINGHIDMDSLDLGQYVVDPNIKNVSTASCGLAVMLGWQWFGEKCS